MIKTSVNTGQTTILVAVSALLLAGAPLRASQTDDRIESSAKKSYVFQHYLTDDSIKIESQNGVVTLTGTVAEGSHIGLARDTVSGLPDVKSVDNLLTVKGEAPAEHSDTWIALKVKTALVFHRNVRATKTDVNVKDGIVTLSGEASSTAQKELTAEYAKDVDNVKEVKNEMTVAKNPDKPDQTIGDMIDDASITAQVMTSLMNHRSTRPVNTRVATRNGEVTLTGIARSEAEKALIAKLAADIQGVVSVKNQMTVDDSTTNK